MQLMLEIEEKLPFFSFVAPELAEWTHSARDGPAHQ
jgi:hypothetical protein